MATGQGVRGSLHFSCDVPDIHQFWNFQSEGSLSVAKEDVSMVLQSVSKMMLSNVPKIMSKGRQAEWPYNIQYILNNLNQTGPSFTEVLRVVMNLYLKIIRSYYRYNFL